MMTTEFIAQIVAQFGAVGILAFLAWQAPKWFKEMRQQKNKELEFWANEREADRLSRHDSTSRFSQAVLAIHNECREERKEMFDKLTMFFELKMKQ